MIELDANNATDSRSTSSFVVNTDGHRSIKTNSRPKYLQLRYDSAVGHDGDERLGICVVVLGAKRVDFVVSKS
jgi:hypothetical protein